MTRIWRILLVCALHFVCLSPFSWHVSATTNSRDVAALKSLQQAWSGPNSRMPSWSGNDPCGSNWQGVVCDGPTGDQVTKLALAGLNLSGPIPSTIGNLVSLESLELSFNENMGGALPVALGQLTSLTSLSIMSSGLTGSIPAELSNCANLSFLALNQNHLTGPIPDVIGKLNMLVWFDISENSIGGPLPVSTQSVNNVGLDNLTAAEHLHFNNNSINGNIPPELFNIPSLLHLLLNSNLLRGSIPKTVGNAQTLQILRLDNNGLNNSLPAELGRLSALTELQLNNNSFVGVLPNLSGLTGLLLLDLSNNNFDQQEVPSWIYSMQTIQTLTADKINLNGTLDSSLFNLALLQTLSLADNALSGLVNFSGNSASSLVLIDLQNNRFSGLSGTPMVNGVPNPGISLRLSGNPYCVLQADAPICRPVLQMPPTWTNPGDPSCKQSCISPEQLNPNVCSCSSPLICDMQLTSPAFSSITDDLISNLSIEWAGNFKLDPSQVYIGSANFTADKRMLYNLLFFPSSGDALGHAQASNITSTLTKNVFHLREGPYLLIHYTSPSSIPSSKSSIAIGVIIGIIVAFLLVAAIIALICIYAVRQKRRADKAEVSRPFASWGATNGDNGAAPQLKGARWFSFVELKKATNNFSVGNEIGMGGYGKVYKGILPGGDVVAVKRADLGAGSMQGATEFKNEIELLSRVHHRNLVGLVGFCYEHGEQMLVYEYMPNGTLRDHLLGLTDAPLSWESRVNIALGSAKGLTYLHELANPPIIHRDVKSSNILLDEKMIAKVADFGLSKLAPDAGGKYHISTQVKGTLGYLDPEYYMTNQLSEKSDVYSFGVILLEIISARQPIEQGRYIVREVRTALNKGGIKALAPLLDPLLGDYPEKQLEAVLDLALRCVEEAASQRPKMNEIVKELEVIAGRSQPNSGVHITVEPQKKSFDLYGGEETYLNKANDPSFQYSGGGFIASTVIEPK